MRYIGLFDAEDRWSADDYPCIRLLARHLRSQGRGVRLTPMEVPAIAVHGSLTRRLGEVAKLVSEGLSNREIGERLTLSEHSIANCIVRILEATGLRNRWRSREQ